MKTKILTIKNVKNKIAEIRKKKQKIVLCHGVFDLLHLGHFEHFAEAKKSADILIVSVTSDEFVNKGPNQPYFNISNRIKALSNIESIDFVIESNSADAINVLKLIRPNYYCKGKDYKVKKNDLTGKISKEINVLKKYGGKIIFTDEISFSSSKLLNQTNLLLDNKQSIFINKIKKKYKFENIKNIIESFNNTKILIIGETIIDKYVFCEAVGKSGKDPMLVFRENKQEQYLGGAAAVANHVSEFSKTVKLISMKGFNKEDNAFIDANLNKRLKKKFFYNNNVPTIVKTRFVDKNSNHKMLGVYRIKDEYLNNNNTKAIMKYLNTEIPKFDIVMVFDYGHGFINSKIANLISKKSIFLALNAQVNSMSVGRHSIEKYNKTTCLIINESELRHELRDTYSSVETLVKILSKKIKFKECVVTMGEKGALVYLKEQNKFFNCPAFASKIIDKIGAGDSFLPFYSKSSFKTKDIDLALLLGSLSAAQSVESIGNSKVVDKVKMLKSLSHMLK